VNRLFFPFKSSVVIYPHFSAFGVHEDQVSFLRKAVIRARRTDDNDIGVGTPGAVRAIPEEEEAHGQYRGDDEQQIA
jgi:hypothetical protein